MPLTTIDPKSAWSSGKGPWPLPVRSPGNIRSGPNAVAAAFSHAAQDALLANVGFIAALILVLALPRQIPSREP